MRAKRTALVSLLTLGLLLAPGPGTGDLLPGTGTAEVPMPGIATAYAGTCTVEVCVKINLKVFEASVCYEKEVDC